MTDYNAMTNGSESDSVTVLSRPSTTVSYLQLQMSLPHHAAKLTLMQYDPCSIFRRRNHIPASPPLSTDLATSQKKVEFGIGVVSFKSNTYSFWSPSF